MVNIYDKVNELASLIRQSEEFKAYKSVKDEVFAEESNKKMITDYQKMQFEAQAAMMSGQPPQEDLMEKLRKMGEVLQFNPKITEFFTAEYRFNTLVSDIYKIIGEAAEVGKGLFEV